MKKKFIVFTVCFGNYDEAFANNIKSHEDYAKRFGYEYINFIGSDDISIGREIAWIKVPLLLGALLGGYEGALFIDSDACITPDCPPFSRLQSADASIFMANGHSGRVNSGVILAFNTPEVLQFLKQVLSLAGAPLPSQSSVGWGENGYFIHLIKECSTFQLLITEWNNTFEPNLQSYIVHYTGPMRKFYNFDSEEKIAWDLIQSRDKVHGEGNISDRLHFFDQLENAYASLIKATSFARFDVNWCGVPRLPERPVNERAIHIAYDISTIEPDNPYVMELVKGLMKSENSPTILTGVEGFWSFDYSQIDILHIQWAELFTGWKIPTEDQIDQISKRLSDIARTTRIIFTVHNLELKADYGLLAERLLDIVGSHCSGLVHLSNASIEAFVNRYSHFQWINSVSHIVIMHGHYDYYRKYSEQFIDFQKKPYKKSVLIFGGLRTSEELNLSLEVARILESHQIQTILAGPLSDKILHWKEQKRLKEITSGSLLRFHSRIPSSQIYSLIKRVDAFFVPRVDRLNSGVVYLGYTFLKPVIAPDKLSIGEAQRMTGSPTYDEGDPVDAASVIVSTLNLPAARALALANRMARFKQNSMEWSAIAKQHLNFYQKMLWQSKSLMNPKV